MVFGLHPDADLFAESSTGEISIEEGSVDRDDANQEENEGETFEEILGTIDSSYEDIWKRGRDIINKVLPAPRTPVGQNPVEMYLAIQELVKIIIDHDVKRFIGAIETLANQIDMSAMVDYKGVSGNSMLHVAAIAQKDDIVGLLLDCVCVPKNLVAAQNEMGDTALHWATVANRPEAAAMLIRRARDLRNIEILRMRNKHGNTPLHEAVLHNHGKMVRLLLEVDFEPVYWKNADQKSPLYSALETADDSLTRALLSRPLDPSRIQGLPPIHGAIMHNKYDLAAKILKKNMELFAMTDSKGGNVFHLAAYTKKARIFRLLRRETKFLAQQQDMNGDLPIHIASKMGHVDLIEKLLPESLFFNGRGQNILHVAAKYGRTQVVRYVLRRSDVGITINDRDHAGNTPLHLAAMHSQPAAMICLALDERVKLGVLNHDCLAALDIALDRFKREPTLRKKLTIMVLKSWTTRETEAVSRDLIVLRPEARDEAFSMFALRKKKVNMEYVKDAINIRLLVGMLVVTVTFAAGFAVPGGFKGSDSASEDDRGMTTMLDKRLFQEFVICNTIAMFCSMIAVINLNWVGHDDVEAAVAAYRRSVPPLTIALLAMSIAFLTGVTLTVGKLPWLANTIFYLGLIFLLSISGSLMMEYPPILWSRHRPIRRLIFWLILAYIYLWGVETYLLDDSEDDRKTSWTSTSRLLDGDGGRMTNESVTAEGGDTPHPPSH